MTKTQTGHNDQEGHLDSVTAVDWHPDGIKLASGSTDETVIIWDALDYSVISKIDMESPILSVDWSPDGLYLAIGSEEGGVAILALARSETILTYRGSLYSDDSNNMVSSVAWHPDGDKLAIAFSKVIEIINASTGDVLHEINGTYWHNSVEWSSDGQKLAYENRNGDVSIFDFSNNSVIQTFSLMPSVNEVTWSPDNKKLAIATHRVMGDVIYPGGCSVFIQNITSGTLLYHLQSSMSVHSVSWNKDGNMIALGGGDEYRGKDGDNTIKMWNLSSLNVTYTNEPSMTLVGHSGEVFSVRWSPDGERIASGSADHTVRIWNASVGSTINVFGIEVPQETRPYPDELGGFYILLFFLAIYGGGLGICLCGGIFVVKSLIARVRPRQYYPSTVSRSLQEAHMKSSICPFCGVQTGQGKFCTNCGAKLK